VGVRSKRLFGPTTATTTAALVYTAPAGETAIIKQLYFANATAVATTVILRVNVNDAAHTFFSGAVAASGTASFPDFFLCLADGETLYVLTTAATSQVVVSAHGAELEGVAD